MNFLLVEDDPTDMKLMSAVLTSGGHSVTQRATAELALDSLDEWAFDAVVVDLKLPNIGGLEMARRIKGNTATQHMPLIALTAAVELFKRNDAIAAGFDAYLVKPIDTRKIVEKIEAVVALKRTEREKQP